MAGALLPLDPSSPAVQPEFLDAGYLQALSQQAYLLVKTAMVWVPLGVLAKIAGMERKLRALTPAALVGLLLVGLPLLPVVQVQDIQSLIFAVPGLALGLWLGKGTVRQESLVQPPALGTMPTSQAPAVSAVPPMTAPPLGRLAGTGAEAAEDRPALGRKTKRGAHRHRTDRTAWSLFLGLGLVALAFIAAADFPRWPLAVSLFLALYGALLWFRPLAWLVVVPAGLPLLDLAPWTGRFYLDEFDLLMLMTTGMLVWRGHRTPPLSRLPPAFPLVALFALATAISLSVGMEGWPALDANAWVSYWSPFNGVRVTKGLLWGGLLYLWLLRVCESRDVALKWLSMGMALGLLGVGLIGVWEHHLFVGFEDQLETYRIVSTFSSMHTGGGHIEAYLVAALPFLWLATTRFRHLVFTGPVMLLTAYVMLYTVARGGVLALGVVLVILLVASARIAQRSHGWSFVAPVAVLAGVGLVLAGGVGVGYFQQRFADTGRDWQIRVDHWGEALAMMDDSIKAQLFGMGLGSFPRIYQERGPVDKQAASFGFASEQGNPFFRLGTGETVYYAQRIPFSAGKTYRLEVDLRSRQGDTRLDTPVCEKQLLNSRQCEWISFDVPGDGAWHRLTHTFSSTKVGSADWWNRPPVELFLYQPGKGTVVDVDNLRLADPDGRNVLCNGDFSRGGDCWFFKTHSHLPWHIKNVWVHVLFEQGWVGLLLFTALTVLALYRLARAGWRGHRLAWACLASLSGLLTVGMFDSLLDTPRLAALLLAWVLLGATYPWEPGRLARRSRRSRLAAA